MRSELSVGALAAGLDRTLPRAWADAWDNVGLIVGDPAATLSGVLVTLDATGDAVTVAANAGLGAVLTHHPPYLEMPRHVTKGCGPDGTLEASLRLGVAVLSYHTNLDRSVEGAEALPRALGLSMLAPLESGTEDVSVVVTYAPLEAAEGVRAAMAGAGAGRLGDYEGCAFTSEGTGWFHPLEGASPAVAPDAGGAPEQRIEMLCLRLDAGRVIGACRQAHPYEEPVVVAFDAVRARGVQRLGRLCEWREGATVGELAAHVSRTLACGVRVWGDEGASAARIAVANGSASSLVPAAMAAADVLVAGEVRYHDAISSVASGLAIIEAGHDMTEWPMVDVLAGHVRRLAPDGFRVVVDAMRPRWRVVEDAHDRG